MIVAIDFDNTFTLDPETWINFMYDLWSEDHTAYIVTSRREDDPISGYYTQRLIDMGVEIIYCDYKAKRKVCESLGIKVDVWVDDRPKYVEFDYPEHEAEVWRNK